MEEGKDQAGRGVEEAYSAAERSEAKIPRPETEESRKKISKIYLLLFHLPIAVAKGIVSSEIVEYVAVEWRVCLR